MDVNSQTGCSTDCLHNAVYNDDIDHLTFLLRQPGIELNHRNRYRDTPLLSSLKLQRKGSFIRKLIEAGCKVNLRNKTTALHLAVERNSMNVASMLINRGAELNVQDEHGRTPIHVAIQMLNTGAICLLLELEVDLMITDFAGKTPLVTLLQGSEEQPKTSGVNYTDLFRIDMAKFFIEDHQIDVNYKFQGNSLLTFALGRFDVELYKTMWSKTDSRGLLKNKYPFLLAYLETCAFPTYDWAQCLYQLLASPVAAQLVKECEDYENEKSLICSLLAAVKQNNLLFTDIVKAISKCVHLGAAHVACNITVEFYMSNDRSNSLTYYENFYIDELLVENHSSLLRYVIGLEEQQELQPVVTYYENTVDCVYCVDVKSIGFFSMPLQVKQKWAEVGRTCFPKYDKEMEE